MPSAMNPQGPPQGPQTPGASTPPFNQEPVAPPQVAGRGILDLSTLPPEVIMVLIQLGVLDQNGMPVSGNMDMMEPGGGGMPGQMGPSPADPRVQAIQRAIGAGRAQVPSGF